MEKLSEKWFKDHNWKKVVNNLIDKDGTEIGWFNAFNVGENDENSLLIVSMVENVKGKGGSHYLLPKVKTIFEQY